MNWLRLALVCILPVGAAEADALAISAAIQARHFPVGSIVDPIFAGPASDQIVGYTRAGDAALWTGAYLAAESFRYSVTRSPEALQNVRRALAGLKALVDVTGDDRLARFTAPQSWLFAAGVAREEANNNVTLTVSAMWVDNTSRDQVVGVFFGLGVAFDLVDDAEVKAGVRDLVTRMVTYISKHQWSPGDSITTTFLLRPEEALMLVQLARYVDPAVRIPDPFLLLGVKAAVSVDVLGNSSYFKFNLAYMSFYHLVRRQDQQDNREAYQIIRNYTARHQNPFFNLIDRALRGPDAARDAETRDLLDQWLLRPKRDLAVDLSSTVPVCGGEACQPIPVRLRVPTDFLWQRSPFQLAGGGSGVIEGAGVDYILPYWMARYYGVIGGSAVQSSAAPSAAVAPGSLASFFGSGLAALTASATEQPLPLTLGGITLRVTDAAGVARTAGLLYVSPTQINFLVPEGLVAGVATFQVSSGAKSETPLALTVPGLYALPNGVAAATAIATQAGNPQLRSPVPVFECTATACVTVPLNVGTDRPVFVTLYGTGLRNRTALNGVRVMMNGLALPVTYAGPTPGFSGLDQVDFGLDLRLRGAGEVSVTVAVDGKSSNAVKLAIQ